MIYLSVLKNDNGDWEVVKTITNTVNVRGNKTGTTYGDITKLSLETRIMEGFWTQNDVYVGTGEFMVFDKKTTTFSEEDAEVTNTYSYKLQPLDEIQADLLSRVDSKRDAMYYAGFTFQDKQFYSGLANRSNIQLMLLNAIVDEANFPSDLVWDTVDGEQIHMDLATFKSFANTLAVYTRSLFITARQIKADIIAANSSYEDMRTAASWNGEAL